MQKLIIIFVLILLILSLTFQLEEIKKNPVKFFQDKLKEFFLISVKDRQKIGTSENVDGNQPKSSWKADGRNYETCYNTETRNGNNTGRKGTYYCNQGIDGGEVIPSKDLYNLDFTNYNIHYGRAVSGNPLTNTVINSSGNSYTLNNDGEVIGEKLTLQQSKLLCDSLKEKCAGFIMEIPVEGNYNAKTRFLSNIDEGSEDPDNYPKKTDIDKLSTNMISYIKKDVSYVEKAVPNDVFRDTANKYINLPTCNWKSTNRCIFKDYKYDQSDATCKSNDGLSYSIDELTNYNEQTLSNWLKTLYNRDMGVNKLASEAVNVNEYVERCKDVDGYEFLEGIPLDNPYIPTTRPGDVKGRFVRISINNNDVSQNWLQLAEVQVISNNKNIAISKSASSSGNYPGSSNEKANDGNNDGNWNNGSVYISGNGSWNNDGNPQFWEVDLGDASKTIDRIIISNRTDGSSFRLSNWLLSIFDNNKNLVWARIYREPPNPKVIIDINASDNDMNNPRVKDYDVSRFNKYFYRVSGNEFKSKGASDCNEKCHKDICEGEKKKWLGSSEMKCRDYKPGEREKEMSNSNIFTYEILNNVKPSEATKQAWLYFLSNLSGLYDTMEISYIIYVKDWIKPYISKYEITDVRVNILARHLHKGLTMEQLKLKDGREWQIQAICDAKDRNNPKPEELELYNTFDGEFTSCACRKGIRISPLTEYNTLQRPEWDYSWHEWRAAPCMDKGVADSVKMSLKFFNSGKTNLSGIILDHIDKLLRLKGLTIKNFINELFGESKTLNLIYRANRDGWHRLKDDCADKGPTLVLIMADLGGMQSSRIWGGYMPVSIKKKDYHTVPKGQSFIFKTYLSGPGQLYFNKYFNFREYKTTSYFSLDFIPISPIRVSSWGRIDKYLSASYREHYLKSEDALYFFPQNYAVKVSMGYGFFGQSRLEPFEVEVYQVL